MLKEIGQTLALLSAIRRVDARGAPRPFTRDEAIVGGLLVRAGKLLHGLLDTAAKQRVELVMYYVRGIVEAAVNVRYLIKFGTPEVFDEYVRYSLRNDHKLRVEIEANIVARGGPAWPIEERMLAGIERSFRVGSIDPSTVDARTPKSWGEGSIRRRFQRLGLDELYGLFFGMPSNHSHGNWHELFAYHLRQVDGGFELDSTWGATPPEPLAAVAFVITDAAEDYVRDLGAGNGDSDEIVRRLDAARKKIRAIERFHEQALNNR